MKYLTVITLFPAFLLTLVSGVVKSNPDGYTRIAEENQTKTFNYPVDLAYGADGQYFFIDNFVGAIRFDNTTFGGDPIKGKHKSGYMKPHRGSVNNNQHNNEYQFAANENETKTFRRPVDLAYGAGERYHYINNFTGTIRFDNKTFGGDPNEGVPKSGYFKYSNTATGSDNINDYQLAGKEGDRKTYNYPVDLAYGAKGQYHYINDFTGTIQFDNQSFGGDPIRGVAKFGYVKRSHQAQQDTQNINDYKRVAEENETKTFQRPVDLAYGANGKYHYINNFTGSIRFDNKTFGGDPIKGVTKAGYVKRTNPSSETHQNINDYKVIANENERKTFHRPVDLAYGVNGKYHYINDFTGTIRFDNKSFGGDPSPGHKKQGFAREIKLNRSNNRLNNRNRNKNNEQQ